MHRYVDPIPALKEQLAKVVVEAMDGWTVENGGPMVRTDYSGLSKLRNGDLRRFSLQKLIRMTTAAKFEVIIDTRKIDTRKTYDPAQLKARMRGRDTGID